MEKQVIINKGGGMYERVIWDDVTKERIPEDTIGFLKGDTGVVPIVGNEFIGQNASIFKEKTFPSECKYCKPVNEPTGIPLDSQCKLLTAIKVQFTDPYCLLGSTLFNLSCTIALPGLNFSIKFYDQNNRNYETLFIETNTLNLSGYLHTGIPHTITVQVIDKNAIGGSHRVGECIRKFKYLAFLGSSVQCLLDARNIYFGGIKYDEKKNLILYKSYGGKNLPSQITIVTTSNPYGPHYMTTLELDVVTDFIMKPALGWFTETNLSSKPSDLLRFGGYRPSVAILGYFNDTDGPYYNNLCEVELIPLTKGILK